MAARLSRREFARIAYTGTAAAGAAARLHASSETGDPLAALYPYSRKRAAVSIVKGEDRRRNVHDALAAIDDQIRPVLKTRKYVILKPNCVTMRQNACTDPDAIRGALDYLAPRFKGPVIIAESSAAGRTGEIFELLKYPALVQEFKSQKVSLLDLNEESRFEATTILDRNNHLIPVRLLTRFMDRDAYVISMPPAKTHLICVITLSVKNMVLAAPLRIQPKGKVSGPYFARPENDKWKIHATFRHCNNNMLLVAQKISPCWGAAVIDAYQGMEKNGPVAGLDVEHRIAVASTDYIAADRVMADAMGINPEWIGHLVYCWQAGIGQFDPGRIDIRGETVASVRKEYQLPSEVERMQEWMRPMEDLPTSVPAL